MDIEKILYTFEDDYNPSSMVPGPRNMYNQGQLVQPNADGSRPGYSGLPRFVTKDPNNKTKPYRVKVKKSELNPKPFSGNFRTLKEAREEASKYKAGTPGSSDNIQLIEKAQSVVDDYNKIVDKAVANKNLTGVRYFETYVKNKFPNTSDQNQIFRQVYKRKMDYRDLTNTRRTLAKDLVNLAMDQEQIVPLQFVYDRLGAERSAKLSPDVQKIVNKGLKNQTEVKVDRAIQSIVEADEIIDDSFMKTVANKIGRSQFGNQADSAWKKAFKKNKFYKDNKKILDYAFTAGGKSTRSPGMSLSEILDDAKYKIGGGVSFSGKTTQFAGLRRYIFDYAKQHWHRNNYDGNSKKSLIEFYDKNGKPIKWKPGLKLKLGEVQFKIPSESNVMWSYSGKQKGSLPVTGPAADASGIFKEVTETYNVMKDISDASVTDPITGKETTYNKLVSKIYKDGYGYQGQNIFGLDQDHFKGVKSHPFKNLRAMDRRLNISLGAIDKTFDNRNLKAKLKKELLGDLANTKGDSYNTALKNYFVDQATNVLDKGATPTLATKSPYYSAVKNVYEQKNLPKTQKNLLEKSYQRATKLENSLLEFAGTITDKCKIDFAKGGRIGFSTGSADCLRIAKEGLEEGLKNGFKKGNQQVLAEGILKSGKFFKDALSLRGLLGPAALAFTAAAEAGIVGYDMLSSGKSFREAIGDSVFNYALGDKTKIDSEEEFIKRLKNIKVGPQGYQRMGDAEIGKMLQFKSNLEDMYKGFDLSNQLQNVDQAILDNKASQDGTQMFPDTAFQLDAEKDRLQADIQDYNRVGTPRKVTDYFLSDKGTKGADASALADLLVRQDQLKDAGKFLPSLSGDKRRDRERKEVSYGIENLLNPPKLDEFGEYFVSRPQSEQSYIMGLGYKEGGIASLNVKK